MRSIPKYGWSSKGLEKSVDRIWKKNQYFNFNYLVLVNGKTLNIKVYPGYIQCLAALLKSFTVIWPPLLPVWKKNKIGIAHCHVVDFSEKQNSTFHYMELNKSVHVLRGWGGVRLVVEEERQCTISCSFHKAWKNFTEFTTASFIDTYLWFQHLLLDRKNRRRYIYQHCWVPLYPPCIYPQN